MLKFSFLFLFSASHGFEFSLYSFIYLFIHLLNFNTTTVIIIIRRCLQDVTRRTIMCFVFCFFSSAWPNEVHTSSFFFSHLLSPHRRLIVPFTSLLIFFTLQVWIIRRTHICFFSALSISSLPCLTPILLYQAAFQNQSVSLSLLLSLICFLLHLANMSRGKTTDK